MAPASARRPLFPGRTRADAAAIMRVLALRRPRSWRRPFPSTRVEGMRCLESVALGDSPGGIDPIGAPGGRSAVNFETFLEDLHVVRDRAGRFRQRVDSPEPVEALLTEALQELDVALEELRVTEEEVRVQNDALHDGLGSVEAESERFQSLFHLAPVAYLVTDRFGVVRQANLRAVGLLGGDQPGPPQGRPGHPAARRAGLPHRDGAGQGCADGTRWPLRPGGLRPAAPAGPIAVNNDQPVALGADWIAREHELDRLLMSLAVAPFRRGRHPPNRRRGPTGLLLS
jgi:PAS domain-containing protein